MKTGVDQHRAATTTILEQDVFAQKKRLADAERKLKVKEAKVALNDQRIATTKIEAFLDKLSLLRGTQTHADDNRIFPMTYAPIVVRRGSESLVRLARYHPEADGQAAVVRSAVPGALQRAPRQPGEVLTQGVRPRSRADDRRLVLRERGARRQERRAAPRARRTRCWSRGYAKEGDLLSFATITDGPPEEDAAAGHDRCIINIKAENLERWLTPEERNADELQAILSDKQQPYYENEIEQAA